MQIGIQKVLSLIAGAWRYSLNANYYLKPLISGLLTDCMHLPKYCWAAGPVDLLQRLTAIDLRSRHCSTQLDFCSAQKSKEKHGIIIQEAIQWGFSKFMCEACLLCLLANQRRLIQTLINAQLGLHKAVHVGSCCRQRSHQLEIRPLSVKSEAQSTLPSLCH